MKAKLNNITYGVIWLVIIANIIRSIVELVFFSQDKDLLHIYNVAIHIICIYSLYLIVEKLKEEGFWIFVFINLINAFAISEIKGEYFTSFFAALMFILILFGILNLKKDGQSAWNLIRLNKKDKNNA